MADMSIEQLLDHLTQFGRPTLRRMNDGGWYADVTLPAPQGVKAEVSSDFDHKTHREALETCLARFEGLRRTVSVDTVTTPPLLERS